MEVWWGGVGRPERRKARGAVKEVGGCFTGYAHAVTCCWRSDCRLCPSAWESMLLTTTDGCGNKANQDLC